MRHPVFIVGSPRSGTSALVDVMYSSGYNGFREGNFLSLLHGVSQLVEQQYKWYQSDDKRVLLSNVEKNDLKRGLFETFRSIVSSLNAKEPWFDKTGNPEMILAIPTLRELWPSAVFVFAKRRGIENVISRMTKFPGHPFQYHCVNWAKNMSSWRHIREQISRDCFLEVEQRNMVRYPESAARELCTFLGISENLLPAVAQVMDTHRPQETIKGSACRMLSLAASGWSDEQVETFLKHCAPEMKAYGYTLDEQYSVIPTSSGSQCS
jgi:sulfotransferase family protein